LTEKSRRNGAVSAVINRTAIPAREEGVGEGEQEGPQEEENREQISALLAAAHRQIAELLREMPVSTLSVAGARTIEQDGVIAALRKLMNEEMRSAFDDISWQVDAEVERRSRVFPPLAAEVLYYAAREAIRNAASHGRSHSGAVPLKLSISAMWCEGLELIIEDNGGGTKAHDAPSPKAGSSNPVAGAGRTVDGGLGTGSSLGGGAGQGLALHSTLMAIAGGSMSIERRSDLGTRVRLRLHQKSYNWGD
jgi:two-component sensor histidine kinase